MHCFPNMCSGPQPKIFKNVLYSHFFFLLRGISAINGWKCQVFRIFHFKENVELLLHMECLPELQLDKKQRTLVSINESASEPASKSDLFLFTAAKNYGHKCFITERKEREMGHNIAPLYCQQTTRC